MTYTLYGSYGTATFGPQAVLEETGLPYRLELIDLEADENKSPHFLALNPFGYVPVLECKDGTVLFEAAAIMLFLTDHHGLSNLAPAPDDPARGVFLKSLFLLTSTVQETYKHFYYPARFTTNSADCVHIKDRSLEMMTERWAVVETFLNKDGPYFLGDRYSLVDIYLVMLVSWHPNRDDILTQNAAVRRNFDQVIARPSLQTVLQDHGVIS